MGRPHRPRRRRGLLHLRGRADDPHHPAGPGGDRRAPRALQPHARAGADDHRPVHRPAQAADRPARAGGLVPASAGDHRGQRHRPHRLGPLLHDHRPQGGHLRGRQPAPGDRAAHGHDAAKRHRRHDAGGDADLPRPDQLRSCASSSTRPPASGASASTASRSSRSTRPARSRRRWRSRCAPSATAARRSSTPRASSSRRSSPPRARRVGGAAGRGRQGGGDPARRGRGQGDRHRLPARSTRASPTTSCSATSTCRCCPSWRAGEANKIFVIPSEFSQALGNLAERVRRRPNGPPAAATARRRSH